MLHMQHAAEMLLKAILVQKGVRAFDPTKQTSIGFEKCANVAIQHAKLTVEEAGLLRAVDAFRDSKQHWLITVPEDVLYLHAGGFITTFDDLLKRTLDDALSDHLPGRILPVSTKPPISFDLLVDREFNQVRELLQPGRRQRDEARAESARCSRWSPMPRSMSISAKQTLTASKRRSVWANREAMFFRGSMVSTLKYQARA
jgi:hypothetical protein